MSLVRPCLPQAQGVGESGGQGLTCPVVQEADASVVMGGDGEGLVWVTHHLVDLGWAWKEKPGEEATSGEIRRTG